ncbi:MAG: DUF1343 domain-containing protein [Myxococcales bacterium]|nr:DUF1343 domain-containing protein [Myxococcales bacterium]
MSATPRVKLGLDRLVEQDFAPVRGRRVGLLCHAASVASDLRHITRCFADAGVPVARCFGPEHGIWADAQDMISVHDATAREPVTGAPVRSLYGADEASLSPRAEDLADLDVLVVDLQDVGSRYYTYIYTAALALRVCAQVGVEVLLLDRPNPIGGEAVEGPMIRPGFESFVGMWSLPTRHGLTIGEVVSLLQAREGWGGQLTVLEMAGWRRALWHDETGLPWVQPSPNMPTLDTAAVYPGGCLLEGTTLSEGRGTTRPFELIGAAGIEPFELADRLAVRGLPGVCWRPVFFRPTFHKFANQTIGGVALHVTDRRAFQPLRAGMHLLDAVKRQHPEVLGWRTEVYEFVSDRLAIDLLFGGTHAREVIDGGADIDALWQSWAPEAADFRAARADFLRYP